MEYVCRKELCTGCGACINICPVKSIDFIDDPISGNKAIINSDTCIKCEKCKQICPIEHPVSAVEPNRCFAGWSTNEKIRSSSASGGIATELYRFYADNQNWFVGCAFTPQNKAVLRIESTDYTAFQNSKYVYSDMRDTYCEVERLLREKNRVLFIGLPCQVAGIKNYLSGKRICQDALACVDIICHGVIRPEWLDEYIRRKELNTGRRTKHIFFRDSRFGTNNYVLSLSDEKGIIHSSRVDKSDEYQLAYHRGVACRDNCYYCQFAQEKRVGDLTIADFTGVGSYAEYLYSKDNISCVLVNTDRGMVLLQALVDSLYIQMDERPLGEEYDREQRLHSATPFPKERIAFLRKIQNGVPFTDAIHQSMRLRIIKNEIKDIMRKMVKKK